MILTIIFVIFNLFMALRAVSQKDTASLFFYLFVDLAMAASIMAWPGFWNGGDEANLMFCGVVGFIDMVCLVIVLMLT